MKRLLLRAAVDSKHNGSIDTYMGRNVYAQPVSSKLVLIISVIKGKRLTTSITPCADLYSQRRNHCSYPVQSTVVPATLVPVRAMYANKVYNDAPYVASTPCISSTVTTV
jgi:hypothetical protein